MSMKEIASTGEWCGTKSPTLKVAMEEWAGPGILALLFLASLAYVACGGTLAIEASPIPEPETTIAAATQKSINTDIGTQVDSDAKR